MARVNYHSPKSFSIPADRDTELSCVPYGMQIRHHNILFSTCSLIAFALMAITLCSCRTPLHTDFQNAENQMSNPTRCPIEDNGLATTGGASTAGYETLPPSAYTGPMPEYQPQPGMEQGAPLPVAAYAPWAPSGIRQPWPEDEYLRDGGGCGIPVGTPGKSGVAGLQMEDTVGVYDTLDGRTLTTPSNEVYIYSPRFAAVRQVVGLVATEQKERISDVYLNASLSTPTVTQKIGSAKQQVQAGNEISARPAQAFRMKQGDGALSSVIGPQGFQNAFKLYENVSIIRQGIYKNSEMLA
jgi:hypothetical protein